jgi:hypothetical protein
MQTNITKQIWTILLATGFLALPVLAASEAESPLALVPQPAKVERGEGAFQLKVGIQIVVDSGDADARNAGEQLAARLNQSTDLDIKLVRKWWGSAIVLKPGENHYKITI